MGYLLVILLFVLLLSLVLSLVKRPKYYSLTLIFRIASVVFGSVFFSYWFVVQSVDRFPKQSITLQLINKLPQPMDFYVITVEEVHRDKNYLTEHLGKIRPEHYRLNYLQMKNSEEYWIVGYIGKKLSYFSDQYLPNKNIDQVIEVENYSVLDEGLAEIAKKHIQAYRQSTISQAIWVTLTLLLLGLNVGLLLKLKK